MIHIKYFTVAWKQKKINRIYKFVQIEMVIIVYYYDSLYHTRKCTGSKSVLWILYVHFQS